MNIPVIRGKMGQRDSLFPATCPDTIINSNHKQGQTVHRIEAIGKEDSYIDKQTGKHTLEERQKSFCNPWEVEILALCNFKMYYFVMLCISTFIFSFKHLFVPFLSVIN